MIACLLGRLWRRFERPEPVPAVKQRFRTLMEMRVDGLIHYNAPFTGGFQNKSLPAGEVLLLDYDPPEGATACALVPERYERFEEEFVPPGERSSHKYAGYSISLSMREMAEKLEKLPD